MLDADRQKIIDNQLVGLYNFAPLQKEPYFSWSACECCKSKLGGERYVFSATVGKAHNNEHTEISCCVDCFMYLFS